MLAGLPKGLPVAWVSDQLRSDADVIQAAQQSCRQPSLTDAPSNGPKEPFNPAAQPMTASKDAEEKQELEESIEVLLKLGKSLHGKFLSAEWDAVARRLTPVLLENVPTTANDALDDALEAINQSKPSTLVCTLL